MLPAKTVLTKAKETPNDKQQGSLEVICVFKRLDFTLRHLTEL